MNLSNLFPVWGNVYLPDHGYLTTLAGKQSYAHHSAIWGVIRGNKQSLDKTMLQEDLNRAIHQQIFDIIIMDSDWNYCCAEIYKYYSRQEEMFRDKMDFHPVTGWKIKPTNIYIAKRLNKSEVFVRQVCPSTHEIPGLMASSKLLNIEKLMSQFQAKNSRKDK